MCSRQSWKAQRYTRDVACALHTFGTRKAFFTQRPHRKTNRLQLPEGRIAPSTVIYNTLASAVPWAWDEGGGEIIRGWQPCDTPQQTSVLDAGTSVAQWWTQCKRDRKKKCDKKTLSHTSKIIAYSPHIQQHTHWTGHKAVGRTMVSTFSISFKSYTWQKNQKEKKKENIFGGHNKHSKELLKTNAKQTISSS